VRCTIFLKKNIMAKTFKIPFAFDGSNKVVDIENAEKGVIYKCNCGSDVKLRGGDIISDHFYHIDHHIDESKCSLESATHKAYKATFQKVKRVKLPYVINGSDVLIFDKVELEKKIDDYFPDAIGYIGDERFLIEFAKSSYIGERKQKKIKKSNLFCLEIDIIKTVTSIREIEKHLVSQKGYKHVIHIPEYKEMKELREKFRHEYYKLKQEHRAEIRKLKDEVIYLKSKVYKEYLFNEIRKGCRLFYVLDCKNGAKMYKRKLDGYGREIVAFQEEGVINVKFNI
jgi:hypothetical protein